MEEKEINRSWRRIIDTMNDGLMLIGTDGAVIMVNRAFEKLTGYTSDEVIGRSCKILNCDACEKAVQQGDRAWCSFFEKDEEVKTRCTIIKKDGSYLPVLKNAALLTRAFR